jgi:hypothetical protein
VAGTWRPPADDTWDEAEYDTLWADVEAWERTRNEATT